MSWSTVDHNLFIQWPWIIRVGYRRLCIQEPPAVVVRQLGSQAPESASQYHHVARTYLAVVVCIRYHLISIVEWCYPSMCLCIITRSGVLRSISSGRRVSLPLYDNLPSPADLQIHQSPSYLPRISSMCLFPVLAFFTPIGLDAPQPSCSPDQSSSPHPNNLCSDLSTHVGVNGLASIIALALKIHMLNFSAWWYPFLCIACIVFCYCCLQALLLWSGFSSVILVHTGNLRWM